MTLEFGWWKKQHKTTRVKTNSKTLGDEWRGMFSWVFRIYSLLALLIIRDFCQKDPRQFLVTRDRNYPNSDMAIPIQVVSELRIFVKSYEKTTPTMKQSTHSQNFKQLLRTYERTLQQLRLLIGHGTQAVPSMPSQSENCPWSSANSQQTWGSKMRTHTRHASYNVYICIYIYIYICICIYIYIVTPHMWYVYA